MGQLPAWTTIVSDHLMDVQLAVTRLALRDGVIDEHEQAVIETIQAAQGGVGNVHDEIAIVAAVVTRGRVPEYLKPRVIELFGDEPQTAA
jgi:hypothetical protein